jgi:hypothetical protein
MAISTLQTPESNALQISSPWETVLAGVGAGELSTIAFELLRRANDLDMAANECGCCKGAAEQCYATCR